MFSYSTGYYVSPPIDQYLKFKNRCSLVSTLGQVYLIMVLTPRGVGGINDFGISSQSEGPPIIESITGGCVSCSAFHVKQPHNIHYYC
jgi:hypothetical protein